MSALLAVCIRALPLVVCVALTGCKDPLGSSGTTSYSPVETDAQKLGKLCALPHGALSVEWSTYEIGSDWGLVARVKMASADVAALMSKMTMADGRAVSLHAGVAPWLGEDGKIFVKAGARFESTIPVYTPGPFAKSPLLNGFVVNPAPDTILVGLHTN